MMSLPALVALASSAVQSAAPLAARTVPVTPAAATSASSLISALLALMLVIALILGLAWLLRRMPGNAFNGSAGLRPVASLAVGAKERLLVVDVGGEQLLLGITAGGISLLHTLPRPLPEPSGGANFASFLGKHLGSRNPASPPTSKDSAA